MCVQSFIQVAELCRWIMARLYLAEYYGGTVHLTSDLLDIKNHYFKMRSLWMSLYALIANMKLMIILELRKVTGRIAVC